MDCATISSASQAVPAAVALPSKATLAPRPARVKVLVVLHSDNWVEIYAQPSVDVHIAVRPHTTNPASASLVDELLEKRMPRSYRSLFYPNKLRCADQCRKLMPEDVLNTLLDLELIHAVQEVGKYG